MNKFLYEANKQKILAIKTAKGLEEELRETMRNLQTLWLNRSDDIKTYETFKYKYKLFTLAFKQFSAKSVRTLPDMFEESRRRMQKDYLAALLKENSLIPERYVTYEELLDVFEFDHHITMPQGWNYCYIPALHNIVQNNPVPFRIAWNDNLSQFDRYSLDQSKVNDKIQYLVKSVRYKQTLSPNKPSTILDKYLLDMKSNAGNELLLLQTDSTKSNVLQEAETKLKQQTKAVAEVRKMIEGAL